MQPVINNQIGSLKESATLFINQLALKLRSEGQNICHLGFGESPFPVPETNANCFTGKRLPQTIYFWIWITGIKEGSLQGFFKREFWL